MNIGLIKLRKHDGAAKEIWKGVGFMGISIMGFSCVILAFVSLPSLLSLLLPLLSLFFTSILLLALILFYSVFSSFVSSLLFGYPLRFIVFTFRFISYQS